MTSKTKGFLLIEVIVTIGILSFGIVTLLVTIHNAISVMKQSGTYLSAVNGLENKLFEKVLNTVDLQGSTAGYEYAEERTRSRYPALDEAEITVNWKEGKIEKSLWVRTYLNSKD